MKSFPFIFILLFCSSIIFGQKSLSSSHSSSDDLWINALGKTKNHPDVKKVLSQLGRSDELNDMDEFHGALWSEDQSPWHSKGVKLGFSSLPSKTLNRIYFYNTSQDYTAPKKLPLGMSFSDTVEKIKARYGKRLREDKDGDFIVKINPDFQPFLYMRISMDEEKVGHAITLTYDEYAAFKAKDITHGFDDDSDICEVYAGMINDVDNKFFSFRGEKDGIFPTWNCNIKLDTDVALETSVYHNYIRITGYKGLDENTAGVAYETLINYFNICMEEEFIPYSFVQKKEQTENKWLVTLSTKEKNIKI